jgi:hypothetical protein
MTDLRTSWYNRTNNLKVVPAMLKHPGTRPQHNGGAMMSVIVTEKRCSTCGEIKPASQFYKKTSYRSGLASQCKACQNIRLSKPEVKKRRSEWAKEWAAKNPAKMHSRAQNQTDEYKRSSHIKRQYKLSVSEYQEMLNGQNGACAICGKPETRKTKSGKVRALSVDHDHKTGRVRGLLCISCNSSIGYAYDDVGILEHAIAYLKKFF